MMFGVNLKRSKALGTLIPRQLIDDLTHWNFRASYIKKERESVKEAEIKYSTS